MDAGNHPLNIGRTIQVSEVQIIIVIFTQICQRGGCADVLILGVFWDALGGMMVFRNWSMETGWALTW